ncbi:MAG: Cys-Xaa-Xaa-Xaa repeat radical SAM target protein [Paludibacteraceae bacterium]|nr:Cys-Xaa-Xaa-Xaa repeat radical SAM target protein [Paludibacteraceae bacterium]
MKKQNQNEELQSRREFFKKAAKAALPVVGAVVLGSLPIKAQAETMGCDYLCMYGCTGNCSGHCTGGCSGYCQSSCRGHCTGTCSTGCGSSAYGSPY